MFNPASIKLTSFLCVFCCCCFSTRNQNGSSLSTGIDWYQADKQSVKH